MQKGAKPHAQQYRAHRAENCIKDNIAYARTGGSTYYKADIRSAYIMDDGRVAITFIIDHTVAETSPSPKCSSTITSSVGKQGRVHHAQDVQEGILYRFAFTISET